MGLTEVNRSWVCCMKCGFYIQVRDYDIAELQQIYKSGYREQEFRGESIGEAFDRVLAVRDSENERRYWWFGMNINYLEAINVLDVGSGIGVWPNILKRAEYEVECVEENQISIDFIYERLGIQCFQGLDCVFNTYDVATLVNVLEHIEDAKSFLVEVRNRVRKGGKLFVEVPDASEFSYLDKNHDEFNSCHVAFYNMTNLCGVVESAGFTVLDMHIEKTKERNLSRIMCLAIN